MGLPFIIGGRLQEPTVQVTADGFEYRNYKIMHPRLAIWAFALITTTVLLRLNRGRTSSVKDTEDYEATFE